MHKKTPGTASKSLNYELRPVLTRQNSGAIIRTSNAGAAWLQYQIFF